MRIIKKVYLSGPITGLPIEEYTALFKMGEKLVRGLKYKPINPVTLNHNHDKSYLSYMQAAIIGMMKADAIMMLPGWEKSNGAVIEHDLAVKLKMPIFYNTSVNFGMSIKDKIKSITKIEGFDDL